MVEFEKFEIAHLGQLKVNGVGYRFGPTMELLQSIDYDALPGMSGTAFVGGNPVGCAGLIPQWPGRAIAWAAFGDVPLRAWPAITRYTRRQIDVAQGQGFRRIEAAVLHGFTAGHRWAQRIGMEPEFPMPNYGPNGETYWMYVRIG